MCFVPMDDAWLIYKLIKLLQDEQAISEAVLRLRRAGQPAPKKRAEYLDSARPDFLPIYLCWRLWNPRVHAPLEGVGMAGQALPRHSSVDWSCILRQLILLVYCVDTADFPTSEVGNDLSSVRPTLTLF